MTKSDVNDSQNGSNGPILMHKRVKTVKRGINSAQSYHRFGCQGSHSGLKVTKSDIHEGVKSVSKGVPRRYTTLRRAGIRAGIHP